MSDVSDVLSEVPVPRMHPWERVAPAAHRRRLHQRSGEAALRHTHRALHLRATYARQARCYGSRPRSSSSSNPCRF